MSGNIVGTPILNQQAVLARDQIYQRKLLLNLEHKYQPISNARWKEYQDQQFINTLQVHNVPTLTSLIADDLESKNQNDPLQSHANAMSNLLTITDDETANYILDRLTENDIRTLNESFPNLLRQLKTKYNKMNKESFVSLVKSFTVETQGADVTERGKQRLDTLEEFKKQQREIYQKEIDAQLKAQQTQQKGSSSSSSSSSSNKSFMERMFNSSSGATDRESQEEESERRINAEKDADYNTSTNYDTDTSSKHSSPKKKTNNYFRNILQSSYPIPENNEERDILKSIENQVRNLKTKVQVADYINDLNYSNNNTSKVGTAITSEEIRDIAIKMGYSNKVEPTTGKGLKRRLIHGRGNPKNIDKFLIGDGKFTIDLEKLRKNILSVVYTSCRASVPSIKKEHISNDVKNIIQDIIQEKFNINLFNKMNDVDKRIVSTFVRTLKIKEIKLDEFDSRYQERYEILQGEVNSGNDNVKVKTELKQYILRGMQEGLIPRAEALNQLFHLSV